RHARPSTPVVRSMPMKYSVRALAAALLLSSTPQLCAQTDRAHDPAILTGEQLAATGKPTVHAAIRELRPNWVRYRRSAQRFPQVYVDSVPSRDTTVLHTLRPQDVRWVQYSSPAEARVRFDTLNRAGAIHVSTRLPLSAAHPALPSAPVFQTRPGVSVYAAALRPVGRNVFSTMDGTGAAATASFPIGSGMQLLASAHYGEVAGPCNCGFSTNPEQAASLLGGEAGVKFHAGRSTAWQPYVSGLLGVHQVRWDPVRVNTIIFREGYTEVALGATVGAGVDVRLGSRLLLTAEAQAFNVRLRDSESGRLASLRLGMTALLGR
ncbi:MAG TPA: hypothetical protein VGX50_06410, partial [Longimicrobium sp.]|nr:hypothetical protein [Longimicrobium sp.]